jgi:hypothetical protein
VDALATIRPDDWNLALFVHVLGAMVATGALALALAYLAGAWRSGSAESLRAGFRALLYGALPGFIVMRLAAQWIYVKEHLDDLPEDPEWIKLGFIITDAGLLFLLIATIVSGVSSRRALAAGGGEGATAGGLSVRATTVLVSVLLVAYVVAIWAMTTKPV